jgi:hypothetical protein
MHPMLIRLLGAYWPNTDDGTIAGNPIAAAAPSPVFRNPRRDTRREFSLAFMETHSFQERESPQRSSQKIQDQSGSKNEITLHHISQHPLPGACTLKTLPWIFSKAGPIHHARGISSFSDRLYL